MNNTAPLGCSFGKLMNRRRKFDYKKSDTAAAVRHLLYHKLNPKIRGLRIIFGTAKEEKDMPQLAVRTRSGRVESLHDGYVCVADSDKNILYSIGNPNASCFLRSTGKPFYAAALVDSGAMSKFNITLKELAITCSSHEGRAFQRRIILSILKKIGLSERYLDCGNVYPENQQVHDALVMLCKRPTPIFSNCSGKHAGFPPTC
jgi:L-asparaginase II